MPAAGARTVLLRRRCRARLQELGGLPPLVEQACRQAGCGDEAAQDLRLVVEEACVNVARHGYRDRAEPGELSLLVERGELEGRAAIRIELRDDGVAFDPLAAAAPELALPAEDRPIGGLGIHMIRSLTDRQRYTRDAQGNRLELWKVLAPTTRQ